MQSVSTPACHAGGRRFESVPGRQKAHASLHVLFLFLLLGCNTKKCNLSHWRLQRPGLSLWESCQPNRLTERVLRLMVGNVFWNAGPSQSTPYGVASSPKGRAKVASLRTMSNLFPFHRTLRKHFLAGRAWFLHQNGQPGGGMGAKDWGYPQ